MPGDEEKRQSGDTGRDGTVAEVKKVEDGGAAVESKNDAPKVEPSEADEFGLPVRPPRRRRWSEDSDEFKDAQENVGDEAGGKNENGDAVERNAVASKEVAETETKPNVLQDHPSTKNNDQVPKEVEKTDTTSKTSADQPPPAKVESKPQTESHPAPERDQQPQVDVEEVGADNATRPRSKTQSSSHSAGGHISEWSHQQLAPVPDAVEDDKDDEGEWKAMPAFATHRIYDDWGKVLAKEYDEVDDEHMAYGNLGGAGKGYTRVQVDDDAQSATSMDDDTAYLFNDKYQSNALYEEDEEGRDIVSQMQTTKELLTEGQRIAYVGLVRLSVGKMLSEVDKLERTKGAKKQIDFAVEATKMWGQKVMVRLYGHMDISSDEQIMVEQLNEHGVLPADLTPALMQNARVKNPAKMESETSSVNSARPSISSPRPSSYVEKRASTQNLSAPPTPSQPSTPPPPPAYQDHTADELTVQDPSYFENKKDLELDLRWTVLCDLFLLLIADSTYDSRSRALLEHVGGALSVDWQEVCRFEKRVTDALEMQEQADKENWNEEEHLETRAKASKKKRMMVMGLCTVGGGLVIGLSAGLLAPVIGAGLAAGFTTIGVAGTSTFLGGTGAAALIGTAGTMTGGIIGVRASKRRTGAVQTFEYRPLFNNKRPNLVVTVAGWMTGNVDDVRLPFSTVDPIMGDIYSIHWEPEMLKSTGQTIQILATEALTQTIQQILGSTILTALMAGLTLPLILTKLSYLIDNPWAVSLARADAAGLILADSIIDRNLGMRPITLVGFSLGSRVIFSALKELAARGGIGLVQNVYMFGSPIVAKKDEYLRARTVVSGRFVNGFATNDWILGYLFRATSGGIMRVSGLASVDVPGIENKDVTSLVPGHMAYRGMMPKLLQEVGWHVESLEFSEIEDPDPENHEKRQRQLIDEIEAARWQMEEKEKRKSETNGKKGGFKSFFSRKKGAQKKEWETYDERSQKVLEGSSGDGKNSIDVERVAAENGSVMFDVDAIRGEALKLAVQDGNADDIKKHLQIKEIESTMPALKISTENGNGGAPELRQTKSYNGGTAANGMPNGASHADNDASWPDERKHHHSHASSNGGEGDISLSFENDEPSSSSQNHRPPLRSAATAPNPAGVQSQQQQQQQSGHSNPWADDEEFGREREMKMSFE